MDPVAQSVQRLSYGLDGPWIESRWGEIFRPSRPALMTTQPPVQWVPALSRVKVQGVVFYVAVKLYLYSLRVDPGGLKHVAG